MFWEKLFDYRWENIAHWLIVTLAILLLSITLIILGITWIKVAPKQYNWRWGYRVFIAKGGKQVWEYANRTMGKTVLVIGMLAIPLSFIIMLPCRHQAISTILTVGCSIILSIVVAILAAHILIKRRIERKYLNDIEL